MLVFFATLANADDWVEIEVFGKEHQSFSKYGKEGKRMDWELKIKNTSYLPEKGKPTEETVKPPNDKQG